MVELRSSHEALVISYKELKILVDFKYYVYSDLGNSSLPHLVARYSPSDLVSGDQPYYLVICEPVSSQRVLGIYKSPIVKLVAEKPKGDEHRKGFLNMKSVRREYEKIKNTEKDLYGNFRSYFYDMIGARRKKIIRLEKGTLGRIVDFANLAQRYLLTGSCPDPLMLNRW